MNTGVMQTLRKSPAPATPSALAAELDDARQRFAEARASIIERGVERQRQLDALIAEAEAERKATVEVVAEAQVPQ